MSRILSLSLLVSGLFAPVFSLHISTGCEHTAMIKSDSSLWVTGSGNMGKLGNGATASIGVLQKIGVAADKWIDVSAGCEVTSAIKSDGSLWSWGANEKYQLGTGMVSEYENTPKLISNGPWKKVSVGLSHSGNNHYLAIDTSGIFWGWGSNNYGQLGIGTSGNQQNTIVKSQSTVKWKDIQVGLEFSVGLSTDGKLYTWGKNTNGNLGDGTNNDVYNPMRVGLDFYQSFSVGSNHVLAIKQDGSLWAWGSNNNGQLGVGQFSDHISVPTQILSSKKFIRISAGKHSSSAVEDNGSLWTWGDNSRGQLRLITGGSNAQPVMIESFFYSNVWMSGEFAYALKKTGKIFAWGASDVGQIGGGILNNNLAFQISEQKFTQVAFRKSDSYHEGMTEDFGMGIDATGKLWGWGANYNKVFASLSVRSDEMGYAGVTGKPVLVGNPGVSWKKIETGSDFVVGLKSDSTLWSWGAGDFTLGRNITSWQTDSVPVSMGAEKWIDVCLGPQYGMAISSDSLLYTWGINNYGQLGNDSFNSTLVPTVVSDLKWVSITCGFEGAYGRTKNLFNYKWGRQLNSAGADVNLVSLTSFSPAFTDMSAGQSHALGLKDSLVYVWGKNNNLQLGFLADSNTVSGPTVLPGISNIMSIVAGPNQSYAISYDGFLWRWGLNSMGQLGTGDSLNLEGPTKINSESWIDVAGGAVNTVAIKSDSSLWCLGNTKAGACGALAIETPFLVMATPLLELSDEAVDAPEGNSYVDFQLFEFVAKNQNGSTEWHLNTADARFSMNGNRLSFTGDVNLPEDSLIVLNLIVKDQNFSDTAIITFRGTPFVLDTALKIVTVDTINWNSTFAKDTFQLIVSQEGSASLGNNLMWKFNLSDSSVYKSYPKIINHSAGMVEFELKDQVQGQFQIMTQLIEDSLGTPVRSSNVETTQLKAVASIINQAPNSITSSSLEIPLSKVVGDTIAFFSTIDPNPSDTHIFFLEPSEDSNLFSISENNLILNEPLSWPADSAINIKVRVEDQGGLSFVKQFEYLLISTKLDPLRISSVAEITIEQGAGLTRTQLIVGQLGSEGAGNSFEYLISVNDTNIYEVYPQLIPISPGQIAFSVKPGVWGEFTIMSQILEKNSSGILVRSSNITITKLLITKGKQDSIYVKSTDSLFALEDGGVTKRLLVTDVSGNPGMDNHWGVEIQTIDSSVFKTFPRFLGIENGNVEFETSSNFYGGILLITQLVELDSNNQVVQRFNSDSTELIIRGVNDSPKLEVSSLEIFQSEMGIEEHLDSFIQLASPGVSNEAKQSLTFEWKIADSSAFVKAPILDEDGGLDFELSEANKTNVSVKLYLRDNGGVLNGGVDETFVELMFKRNDPSLLPQLAAPEIPDFSNRFAIMKIENSMEFATDSNMNIQGGIDTVLWLKNDDLIYLRYKGNSDSSHSKWVQVNSNRAVEKNLFFKHEGSILGVDLAHNYSSPLLYKQSVNWKVVAEKGAVLGEGKKLRGVVYPISMGNYKIEYTVYDSIHDYTEVGISNYEVTEPEKFKVSSRQNESIWRLSGMGSGKTQKIGFSEFWTWDPNADFDELMARYKLVEKDEGLELGLGYWVRIDSSLSLDMSEMSYKDGELELKLIAEGDGWYLVSNPYDFSLEVSEIEGTQNLDFWTWNRKTTDYTVATQLLPFQGAWVNVKNDVTLKFPFLPSFLIVEDSNQVKPLSRYSNNEDWSVNLNLQSGLRKDFNNKIGMMRNGFEAKASTEIPQPQSGKINLSILSSEGTLLKENLLESGWGNPRWGLVFQSGVSGVSKADFWVQEDELNSLEQEGKSLWLVDRQGERKLTAGNVLEVAVNQPGNQAVLELRAANASVNQVSFNINSRNIIELSEGMFKDAPTEIRLIGFDGRLAQKIIVDYDSQKSTITPKDNARPGLFILEVCSENSCTSLGLAQFK